MFRRSSIALCVVVLSATSLFAQQWGDVRFRLVYDGPIPTPEKLGGLKGQFCGNLKGLVDESLLVDDSGGIKNAFVFVVQEENNGIDLTAIHPSAKPTAKTVTLANKNCRFEPHALLLQRGDTLRVTNPDPEGHNANLHFIENPEKNLTIAPGKSINVPLAKAESVPCTVECNIHSWMSAKVLVLDTGYGAISNAKGEVVIKNLPVGKVALRLIHERQRSMRGVKIGDGELSRRNIVEITVKPGMNDFGDIKLSTKMFR